MKIVSKTESAIPCCNGLLNQRLISGRSLVGSKGRNYLPTATKTPLYLAGVFGAVAMLMGIYALTSPQAAALAYGASSGDGFLRDPFVAAFGARNIVVGLAIILLALFAGRRATGILLLCSTISGTVDARVTYRFGQPGALREHMIGTLVLLSLSVWLFLSGKPYAHLLSSAVPAHEQPREISERQS